MAELIDTTEMYLKAIYELCEEGILPLRARIVERLGQSGPTVSETVSRMERDGLLHVAASREICLTEKGKARAISVIRRHRLAERLIYEVIGLKWELVHAEACGWEHVMSGPVEQRIVQMLGEEAPDPYGNPIPPAVKDGESPAIEPIRQSGEQSLEFFLAEANMRPVNTKHAEESAGFVADSSGSSALKLPALLVRIGEPAQADETFIVKLAELGICPGTRIVLFSAGEKTWKLASAETEQLDENKSIMLTPFLARHLHVRQAC